MSDPNQLLTERDIDITVMECIAEVDDEYQAFLTETLGNRANPIKPPADLSQVKTQLPVPAPAPLQAPQGAPPTAPNVGGY